MKVKTIKICRDCGDEFKPFKTTDCRCVDCTIKKAVKDNQRKRDRAFKEEGVARRKKLKQMKIANKSHASWQSDLQPFINTICRLIDHGLKCISCPGKGTQAGHYHSRGANNSIRFNLHNLHTQEYNCNVGRGSNRTGYNLGLVERYGKSYQEFVEYELVRKYPFVKLSIPELHECISRAKRIIVELKDIDRVYTADERYWLREKYNAEIGIYTKQREA